MVQRRTFILNGLCLTSVSALGLSGCGSATGDQAAVQNSFVVKNLAATDTKYQAKYTLSGMVDAWGIAIRPAGAGGHFWVGGGGTSWQFVGDVKNHPTPELRDLTVDQLTEVYPAVAKEPNGDRKGFVTGVAFNGAPIWEGSSAATKFVVSPSLAARPQTADGNIIEGSARFVFVSDSGQLSAWSERRADNGAIIRVNGNTQLMYDGEANGHAYFGVAIKADTWDTLWVADFGREPQLRQFDSKWNLVTTKGFINPFSTGGAGKVIPGDFAPFNITVLNNRVFVTYSKTQPDPLDSKAFFAAEENAVSAINERASNYQPDNGRLVEFTMLGELVRIFDDEKHLNAPWGVAIAPKDFGIFSDAILVGNFGGAGLVMGFTNAGKFIGYLQTQQGNKLAVDGLWGLQFGNGASLGDSDAMYFAAGPEDETQGLFGSIRYAPG
jgi:uncharacterized protein (TIGR03118 family)